MRLRTIAIAALLVGAPLQSARAGGEHDPAEERRIRIAVLDVMGSGPVDRRYVEGLSGVLAARVVARRDLLVTTSADVRQLVGFEAERQLMGCEDDAGLCLTEVAGALGVDYVIAAEVSRIGDTWLFNAALLDMSQARTVNRISRRTRDENALIDVVGEATDELLSVLGLAPPPRVRPTPTSRRSFAANAALGAGAVAIAGGAVLYGGAWSLHSAHQAEQLPGAEPTVSWSRAQSARRNAGIGIGLMAGGAAVTAASFLLPRNEPGTAAFAMIPVPQGGLFVFSLPLETR